MATCGDGSASAQPEPLTCAAAPRLALACFMATRPTVPCARCGVRMEAGKLARDEWCWPCLKAIRANEQRQAGLERTCQRCGGPIAAGRDKRAIWCTPRCQREASRERLAVPRPALEPRACGWCGELFTPARRPEPRFCCREHAVAAGNARRSDPAALPARPRTDAERLADVGGGMVQGLRARYGKHDAIVVPDWPDAACRSSWLPPDTWADPRSDEEREAARAVCQGCPRLAECREFGISHVGVLTGVWGGLCKSERTRLRRARLREQQEAGAA
jgi:hypothetical protein